MRCSRAGLIALNLAWGSWSACAVFPDEAVLPASHAPGGGQGFASSGSAGSPLASAGNSAVVDVLAGEAGSPGSSGEPGGGAGGDSGGTTQAGGTEAGGTAQIAGSDAGGTGSCKLAHARLMPSGDAWIDAAEPQVNHGADTQLFVLGGSTEQRALLTFTVPKSKAGDVFMSATLVLTLSQQPNLGAETRVLDVYALLAGFNENRVTWLNYANGTAHRWATAGGDLSESFGTGTLRASASTLRLDASALVQPLYSSAKTELDVLVRDAGSPPAAPINFAFVAKDGSADASPILDIEYCRP